MVKSKNLSKQLMRDPQCLKSFFFKKKIRSRMWGASSARVEHGRGILAFGANYHSNATYTATISELQVVFQ
jgi:hypothetical protein